MNWNNYDTKYIIKRLIIGFGMLILFSILTTFKAHALTSSADLGSSITTREFDNTINLQIFPNTILWKGVGEGEVLFTFMTNSNTTPSNQIKEVYVVKDNNYEYVCDLGSVSNFVDNQVQRTLYTARCPVNFDGSHGLKYLHFARDGQYGKLGLGVSSIITFVSKDKSSSDSSAIISALQQSTTDLLNGMQFSYQQINNTNNQIAQQQQQYFQQQQQDVQDIKNSINNDNVDGANNDLDNFKNSSTFSDSTGLQAVLELPLNLVNSFTNTCQPITITIPFIDYTGTIPCMSTIYRNHFNGLYSVVALIVNAFFIYRILLKIYELVHNAKQPDEDKLEVIDL